MAYSRWSNSNWYIFWHCETPNHPEGGLAVWGQASLMDEGETHVSIYTKEEIIEFVTGQRPLADIPGWKNEAIAAEKERVIAIMVEWLHEVNDQPEIYEWKGCRSYRKLYRQAAANSLQSDIDNEPLEREIDQHQKE